MKISVIHLLEKLRHFVLSSTFSRRCRTHDAHMECSLRMSPHTTFPVMYVAKKHVCVHWLLDIATFCVDWLLREATPHNHRA